jgi:hypothetical protein
MLKTVMGTVLAIVFVTNADYAQRGAQGRPTKAKPSAEQLFKRLDGNNDGKLSPDEFKGKATEPKQLERRQRLFNLADADKDGSLSRDYSWPGSNRRGVRDTNPKRKRGQLVMPPSLALRVGIWP